MDTAVMRLADGRDLEYAHNDVADSAAVIFHHGTLSDLVVWASWLDELAERDVAAVAFNRSGYGRSSSKVARITRDVGRDVSALADHLGLDAFVSVGWSGGGSHALATGLDPRCRGVVTLAGIAPFAVADLDFYDGMKEGDVREYHAALRDIDELIALIKDPRADQEWCEPDRLARDMAGFAEVSDATRRCVSYGYGCLVDDYSAYLSPWGFAVESLEVPVVIFQGDLDQNVPVGHARWLSRHIARSRLRLYRGEGHLSLVLSHREEILASVLELLEDPEPAQ